MNQVYIFLGTQEDEVIAYDSASGSSLTGSRYYPITDHLGSVVGLTSSTGVLMERYLYDAYGKPYRVYGTGSGIGTGTLTILALDASTGSLYGNSRLYTGRYYDREIGLSYHRARYYDPTIGRFMSRDPIGQRDQVNLFTYVGNSPMMYVDRDGREKTLIIGFAGRDPLMFGELTENQMKDPGIGSVLSYYKDKNVDVKGYNSSVTKLGSEKWDALEYIESKKGTFNKLIILGHSLGADNSVELSQLLDEKDIKVDLLVTVDLQSAFWDTTTVNDNVDIAKNYYQTNWNSTANGDILNLAEGNNETQLSNINATTNCMVNKCPNGNHNFKYYHTEIDDYLGENQIIKDINSTINKN